MSQEISPAKDRALSLGAPIFTRDGEKIGVVKEVLSAAFKIDAAMQPDYWLAISLVESAADDRAVLAFDEAQLGHYKLDSPDDALDPRRGRLNEADMAREE